VLWSFGAEPIAKAGNVDHTQRVHPGSDHITGRILDDDREANRTAVNLDCSGFSDQRRAGQASPQVTHVDQGAHGGLAGFKVRADCRDTRSFHQANHESGCEHRLAATKFGELRQ
jgi:hypothetical protein